MQLHILLFFHVRACVYMYVYVHITLFKQPNISKTKLADKNILDKSFI